VPLPAGGGTVLGNHWAVGHLM
nr:bombesin-like peptide [Homo sapiens]